MKKPSLNIYDFFNSPDVAEHCRSIGHTFSAVESAVMIHASNARTLAEKHAAYKAVIAELPDMSLPKTHNREDIESFHKALEKVIAYDLSIIKRMMKQEAGTVYQAAISYKCPRDNGDDDDWECDVCSTYEKAVANALEFIKGEEEALDTPGSRYCSNNFRRIAVHKIYIDRDRYDGVFATLSKSGEILSVWESGLRREPKISGLLDSIYIDVPVPFKAGDLVEYPSPRGWTGDVYVLQNICRDHEKHKSWLLTADRMDMTAWIYFERYGNVDCECMHFYPDLRYCRRELAGEKRILKYISLQMQEKICLCTLLKIQKYLMLDKLTGEYKNDHELKYQLKQIDDGLLGGVDNKKRETDCQATTKGDPK